MTDRMHSLESDSPLGRTMNTSAFRVTYDVILALAMLGVLTLPLLALLGFIGAAGTVAYSVGAPSLVLRGVPRCSRPGAPNLRVYWRCR